MLNRIGARDGKPRITHTRLIHDADQEQAFFVAMLSATAGGFPIAITDGLRGCS